MNKDLCYKNPILSTHDVRPEHRSRLVQWLAVASEKIPVDDQTYFSTIQILDSYFEKSQLKNLPIDKGQLYLIGITCILIAAKVEEVNPLSVIYVEKYLGHHQFS